MKRTFLQSFSQTNAKKLFGAFFYSTVTVVALTLISGIAHAVPSKKEAYRSDRLKVIVYSDRTESDVLWYLPPVKLYEEDGKLIYYKREEPGKVNYFFYVVAYMTDDLVRLLAGELPGLSQRTQFKPIIAKQFGIQVKQFESVAMSDMITDYQYLNNPQLVKFSLPKAQAEEFEFFISHKPGVQANVIIAFDGERMDKDVTISLSYKEVYDALNVGATGQYKFLKADISKAVTNYMASKNFLWSGKGDIQMPDVVNKVIDECFTPFQQTKKKKKKGGSEDSGGWDDSYYNDLFSNFGPSKKPNPAQKQAIDDQLTLLDEVTPNSSNVSGSKSGNSGDTEFDFSGIGQGDDGDGSDFPSDNKPKKPAASLEFVLNKELEKSNKNCFFKQEHFADSTETASVPVYINLDSKAGVSTVAMAPLPTKTFTVEATNAASTKALAPGIMVKENEQYIITAVFSLLAKSHYSNRGRTLDPYRWDSSWPSADEELYYRVGEGPWEKVNGRAVVKLEGIYKGELQFYLDRKRLWEKIPEKFKESKALGLVKPIWTYGNTFPQFSVTVTGRKAAY